MTTSLTASQLADVILQVPGRVTAGILAGRATLEAWRDDALLWPDRRSILPASPSAPERANRRLFLYFSEQCALPAEHPRSLLKALRELKCLGFSNHQLEEIAACAHRYILTHCESGRPLHGILPPGKSYEWNDKAFLGAALINISKDYKRMEKMMWDPSSNQNTIFTPQTEQTVYETFPQYVSSYVGRRSEALFLTPQVARPRAAAIMGSLSS